MWFLKFLIILAFVFAVALLGTAIRRRMARRTIASWAGRGVNRDLSPPEVAVLLEIHPSIVVFLVFLDLEMEGRVALESLDPIGVEWTGGVPEDPVAAAFRGALDERGRLTREGIFDLLQAIWDRLDRAMMPYSGRETAIHYRELISGLWDEVLVQQALDPALFPWLLLRDVLEYWDEIRDGPEKARYGELVKTKERFRDRLLDDEDYLEARKERGGYFRYLPRIVDPRYLPPEFQAPG